jgi:hypothetical protein
MLYLSHIFYNQISQRGVPFNNTVKDSKPSAKSHRLYCRIITYFRTFYGFIFLLFSYWGRIPVMLSRIKTKNLGLPHNNLLREMKKRSDGCVVAIKTFRRWCFHFFLPVSF